MTAISTTTGGWCCRRAARAAPSRERARSDERDKPQRARGEKRTPLKQRIAEAEAEIARINGIIAKIDTALALPDLFTRDPKQAAQLTKARAERGGSACSAPRKNGWKQARIRRSRRG